jgi:hypothetical protein
LRTFSAADPAGLVVAGCDPAFGVAERLLDGLGPRSLLAVSAPTGTSLEALSLGRVHAAVVHGRARKLPRAPVPVARWHVARWHVGVGVAPELRSRSLEAVLASGVSVARRDPAAASQQAFERARQAAGIERPCVGRRAPGHLDAARLADAVRGAAVTTEAAAHAFRLDFLALENHIVELWVDQRWVEHLGVRAVSELLGARAFTERIAQFAGYDLSGCGERVGFGTS